MTKEEEKKRLEHLKGIVSNLPNKPGSYQYYDKEGTIIYVGKAKNLKNRVSSYFHKEVDRFKTKVLVSKIWNITYTVVNTEEDALLLENNLIKKYQPKYNILLKDGKTYPSICITKEFYPRIFKTRVINKKFGTFYGPYSHIGTMYALLDIIKKLYKPRTCRTPITEEGIRQGKYRPCLDYHIKNCGGACIGKQTHEEYLKNINQAREILKGNTREVEKLLFEEMQQLATELRFEEAEEIKKKYLLLKEFCSKSEVVSHTINNVDVFSVTDGGNTAFVNYLHVTNGNINQAFTFEFKKKLDEEDKKILPLAIMQIREKLNSTSREIVVPYEIELPLKELTLTVPQRGDKKTLLELSEMNGKQYRFDRLKQAEKLNPEQKSVRLMKEIQQALKLPKMPYQIECFDNSNISGTDAVAACVVFKKMKPSKKDYRKYNIKTVVGPDDYASMKEVITRRLSHAIKENTEGKTSSFTRLPDLILMDGGKTQVHAAEEVLLAFGMDIPVCGMVKDDRHRTRGLLFHEQEIRIPLTSEGFKLVTRIQDEVHRFAITYHRKLRDERNLHSVLDDIKGIGEVRRKALLRHFGSIERIAAAEVADLLEVDGMTIPAAEQVYLFFHREELQNG